MQLVVNQLERGEDEDVRERERARHMRPGVGMNTNRPLNRAQDQLGLLQCNYEKKNE